MSHGTFTHDVLAALGVPPDSPEDVEWSDTILADEHVSMSKYSQTRRCIFLDDTGTTWAVTYEAQVDAGDYEVGPPPDNHGWHGDTVEAVEVEAVPTTVIEWHPVGDKPAPTPSVEGGTGSSQAPPGDQFTAAVIRRSAYLDAAAEAEAASKLFPDDDECAAAIGALEGLADRLRRLAKHHTAAEQPVGLTWEARADHAVRLYARTAIQLEDTKAENTRLRARLAELEQPTTTPQTITVDHVEAALRGWLAHFDYDLHKATECSEDDGEDTYPAEAADFFARLWAAASPSV
ncbi:hypothetical protein [Nonomuraea sp. NPDC001636]|uniref:hypothetical protein n=1 Tax=Actinomycetes TaxID=1760 RepID=UPI003329D2C2